MFSKLNNLGLSYTLSFILLLTLSKTSGSFSQGQLSTKFESWYMGFGEQFCKLEMIIYKFAMVFIPCLAHVVANLVMRPNVHTWSNSISHQPLTKAQCLWVAFIWPSFNFNQEGLLMYMLFLEFLGSSHFHVVFGIVLIICLVLDCLSLNIIFLLNM